MYCTDFTGDGYPFHLPQEYSNSSAESTQVHIPKCKLVLEISMKLKFFQQTKLDFWEMTSLAKLKTRSLCFSAADPQPHTHPGYLSDLWAGCEPVLTLLYSLLFLVSEYSSRWIFFFFKSD